MTDSLANMSFQVALKTLPTEGHLVYEYNPFRNYRLEEDKWFYKGNWYTDQELADELGVSNIKEEWKSKVPKYETPPVRYMKGQLVDFITDKLDFSLQHPVQILPQYSYDNSVDLIINDGINPPRLINSRFSATERNKYKINDRKGDNDTNIYDEDSKKFDQQTS